MNLTKLYQIIIQVRRLTCRREGVWVEVWVWRPPGSRSSLVCLPEAREDCRRRPYPCRVGRSGTSARAPVENEECQSIDWLINDFFVGSFISLFYFKNAHMDQNALSIDFQGNLKLYAKTILLGHWRSLGFETNENKIAKAGKKFVRRRRPIKQSMHRFHQ